VDFAEIWYVGVLLGRSCGVVEFVGIMDLAIKAQDEWRQVDIGRRRVAIIIIKSERHYRLHRFISRL